jgi:hypothetical protein
MLVKSDNLYSLNLVEGNLHAVFNSRLDLAYKYYGVPEETYNQILNSPSIGEAFNQLIIKSRMPYRLARIRGINPETGVREEMKTSQPFNEFTDVISYLESRGLARKENDENGEIRVVFNGEWAKEMEGWFRRSKL